MSEAAERVEFTASSAPSSSGTDGRVEATTLKKRVVREVYRKLRSVDALTVPLALFDISFRARGFLREKGWFESYRAKMPLQFGKPVPFYTYAAIEFLEPRIDRSLSVFEYGSGNSTLWWAARVKSVVACEHEASWIERMRGMVPANVQLVHRELVPNGTYSREATNHRADVIVVDGRDRVNCAKNCLPGLTERGVIVWDNSERERYREGQVFLKSQGFRRIDFGGYGPIDWWPWCTTVFYRDGNCLGI